MSRQRRSDAWLERHGYRPTPKPAPAPVTPEVAEAEARIERMHTAPLAVSNRPFALFKS